MPQIIQPREYYFALIYLSIISAVAFSIWFILLKQPQVKVSELNIWTFIIPIIGAISSWLFLAGESPDLYSIRGMICIVLSIIVINQPIKIIKYVHDYIEK